MRGAATEKARSPTVQLCDGGTSNPDVDAERRRLLESVSAIRRSSLAKYDGAILSRACSERLAMRV